MRKPIRKLLILTAIIFIFSIQSISHFSFYSSNVTSKSKDKDNDLPGKNVNVINNNIINNTNANINELRASTNQINCSYAATRDIILGDGNLLSGSTLNPIDDNIQLGYTFNKLSVSPTSCSHGYDTNFKTSTKGGFNSQSANWVEEKYNFPGATYSSSSNPDGQIGEIAINFSMPSACTTSSAGAVPNMYIYYQDSVTGTQYPILNQNSFTSYSINLVYSSSSSGFNALKSDPNPQIHFNASQDTEFDCAYCEIDYYYYAAENLNVEYECCLDDANFVDLQNYSVHWNANLNLTTTLKLWDNDAYTSSSPLSINPLSTSSCTIVEDTSTAPVVYLDFTATCSDFELPSVFAVSDVYFKFYEDDPPSLNITSLSSLLAPSTSLSNPYCNSTPLIEATTSDGNGISCVNITSDNGLSITLDNSSINNFYIGPSNDTFNNWFNNSTTSQGNHTLSFIAYDTCGNPSTNQALNIVKDTINPSLIINNYTAYSNTVPMINCSVNDANLDDVYVSYISNIFPLISSGNGTYILNGSCINQSNQTQNFTEFWNTDIGQEPLTVSVIANDSAGNMNLTALTITKDTILPCAYPSFYSNSTSFGSSLVLINNTRFGNSSLPTFWSEINDTNADNSTYSLNLCSKGVNETFPMILYNLAISELLYTVGPETVGFNSTWDLCSGSTNVTISATDLAGNYNSTQYNVFIDRSFSSIKINSPQSGEFFNNTPTLNVTTISSENISSVTYSISDTSYPISNYPASYFTNGTYNFTIDSNIWADLSQGNHTIALNVTNLDGNSNYTSIVIEKDTYPPVFQNLIHYSTTFCYDFNITELSLNASSPEILYQNGTFIQNAILCGDSGSTYEFKGSLNVTGSDGNYSFIVNYIDILTPPVAFNNSIWLIVDTINPVISSSNIINETSFFAAPTLNLTIGDANPYSMNCTFLNESESFNITQDQNISFSINSNIWENLSDGHYTIQISIEDRVSHISNYEIVIVKDTTPPNITIVTNLPNNATIFYETPPDLNLTGDEEFSVIYYISIYENFSVNYTLTEVNSSEYAVPTDLWANLPYKNDTLYIMGVDQAGNYEIVQFDCQKWDNIAPEMTITAPTSCGQISPLISVDIVDDNFEFMYYYVGDTRVDIDLSSITISQDTTVNFYIDQTLWNEADSQTFNITIFSVDRFGNTSNKTISILRTDYIPPLGATTHQQRGNDLSLSLFLNMQWQVIVILVIVFAASYIITRLSLKKSLIPSQVKEALKL